jgi:potassium efflux system protein
MTPALFQHDNVATTALTLLQRIYTAMLVVFFTITFSSAAVAADAALPKRASVEKSLAEFDRNGSLSELDTIQQHALRNTLKYLDELDKNQERLKSIEQAQRQAPAELAKAKSQLAEFAPYDPEKKSYDDQPIELLVKKLTSSLESLKDTQENLSKASSQLINYQTLPEQAQTTLQQALKRLEEIRQQLNLRAKDSDELTNAQVTALETEREALNSRIDLRTRELWSSDALRRIAIAKQSLLNKQVSSLEIELESVQKALNSQRRLRIESLIKEASEDLPGTFADLPHLNQVMEDNRALTAKIISLSQNTNNLIRENIDISTRLDRVRQTERNLSEQIELLKGSLILSRILYQTQKNLAHINTNRDLGEKIKDLRLEQFQLNQQQADALEPSQQAEKTLSGAHKGTQETAPDDVRFALTQLLKVRDELRSQLDAEMSRILNLAISMQVGLEQLVAISENLRSTVREQSFWMPSNQNLDLDWWLDMPQAFYLQLRNADWRATGKTLQVDLAKSYNAIAVLLIAIILLFRRRHWKRQLAAIESDIGRVRADSQLHTPRAITLGMLLEAPVPLLLCALSLLFNDSNPAQLILGSISLRLAMLWMTFAICLRLLRPGGITEKHFHWGAETSAQLRKWLIPIGVGMIVPSCISGIEMHRPELLPDNVPAMLLLMVSALLIAVGLFKVVFHYPRKAGGTVLRATIALFFALLPLTLILITELGYFYSAAKLSSRLIESFYLAILWGLLSSSAVRGMAVAARRLTFKRAIARRQARDAEQKEASDAPIDEPPLDMQQVNQQSLRLLRLALLISFSVIFYLVWSDLLGTFGYMNKITLWETSVGEGVLQQWIPTSLGDVITALVTIIITLMLSRNLPGLLEVLVLSRLTMRPGSSYAITTLLSYTILSIGFLSALSSMGFAWEKLQWLVAALGVGLGFGLQEIFANFVSGLIILFERPARIGDVITIGDLSGTVSRIRIRATTITDFERKEIIVPNKSFVTDRLINWSLTDSITRITITVGFAYGSDLDKAYSVLMQAAKENPRVLKDPEPVALFLTFGASTLDHELRVHVKEVSDRLPATHELNRRIDALCREHDLEIAFSQLDIHIRSKEGDEVCVTPDTDEKTESGKMDKAK